MAINPNNLSSTATLTFDDEFSSLSLYNGVSGTWSTQPPYVALTANGSSLSSNGEQEWYVNSNYAPTASITPWTVNNGILTLTAAPAPASIQPLIDGYQYTSGEINTYHSFSQTYGFFEMSAKLPAGQGLWPAFWLLPENGSWPPELDIMEVLGNNAMQLYTTVHSGSTNVATGNMATVANMSTGFHTYAVDWEPTTITWYFDGQKVFQTATPSDMNQPMYIIANLAVGGYWPGDVNGTTPLPAQMDIDWIRAYQSDANLPPGTIATPPAASPPANPPSGTPGQTLTANDTAGQVLTGGAGNDTFYAGHNSVVMTGGGGADTFVFQDLPWNAGQITDFNPASDKLDLTALFTAAGYTGSNPLTDGYISFASDGAGDTKVYFDPQGTATAIPTLITTLDNVSPGSVSLSDVLWSGTTPTSSANPAGSTAVFSSPSTQYTFSLSSDHTSLTITPLAGGQPTVESTTDTQFLQFTDKTVFVENSVDASIARLYSAALDRAPDAAGLSSWEQIYALNIPASAQAQGPYVTLAETGVGSTGLSSIAAGFVNSSGFQAMYGSLNDAQFISTLYENVLGRAPSSGESAAWLNLMTAGDLTGHVYSQEMVVVGLAESAENIAKTGHDWLLAT